MNFRLILNIMGYTLWVEAGCLLLPLLVSVGYGEACWEPFLWTLGLCSLCGLILTHIPARKNRLQGRDGYTVVAMAWVVLCLFGAVPYVLSGAVPHYADALFETASGLTTTGATILTDVEAMPRGILFWRALTQWMGGMGVLVLFLALMPWTGAGAVHLMRAESPGPIKSKLLPHVNDTAKVLYGIYIGLTAAEIVALCLAGMDFYEAVLHSFSTISTGGFSTRNASIAAFGSPAITWIVAIFMFLSGINFSLIFISLRGHIRAALHSEELRLYTLLTLGSIGLIAASLMVQQSVPLGRALKDSVFNAVSTVTTTGFATADFAQWPVFGQMLLVILMFTGACAGSTSGGIKVSRILLLGKLLHREIKKILHPKHISVITVDGQLVETGWSLGGAYMVAYMILFAGWGHPSGLGQPGLYRSFTAVLTCLGNVGPGLVVWARRNFSPFSGFSKVVMSLLIFAGAAGVMPILVMLSPRMWQDGNATAEI
ncbi:MAG: TrkH family potassium uptake protein [Oscillospiraceae bacterium]